MRAVAGKRGGFTLVEVLVALAIVTVGLAALFNVTSQSVRTSSYLREKTFAEWIALNKLTETRVSGKVPAQSKTEGKIEYANLEWRWELEKVTTPVEGIVRLESRVALETTPEGKWIAHATGFMGNAITFAGGTTGTGLNWAGDPNRRPGPGGQGQGGQQPGHGEGHGPQPPGSGPQPPSGGNPPGQDPVVDPGEPQQ